MKQAVSISIGSSRRNKTSQISILGETVRIERIGTDGDMEKAAHLFAELDGQVDAFGVGGTDLGLLVDQHWFKLHSVQSLVRFVQQTPIVDGNGLKTTLERQVAPLLDRELAGVIHPRRVLLISAMDRWGMASSFADARYTCLFGDLMFTLGIAKPLYSRKTVKRLASVLMPVASRVPFRWVYPTGKDQEKRTPKWIKQFEWATVIAGDCHYITRYMPDQLKNKVIVTNTTTEEDRALFAQAGVRYLLTTTPVLDGRSFGTNLMEAAILAASGRKEPVNYAKPDGYFTTLENQLKEISLMPQIQELN